MLAAHQAGVAARFAVKPSEERFENLAWLEGPTGDPVVDGAAAWVACSVLETHEAGDHTILLGEVEALEARDVDVLVFHRGRYGTVTL